MSNFFSRAHAAHREGRLADAERDYRATLATEPGHVDALHWLGVLHHQRGEHRAAAELVGQAARLRPSDAGVQLNLGTVMRALGRLDDAIERFRNALHLRGDFALAHYNLGNAYAAAGRHADAADSFQRALELQPNDVRARVNLGTSLIALDRHEEAARALRDALRLDARHAGAHNNLGMALNGIGALPDALDAFRAAIDIEPRYVAAHFNLANTLDALGRHAEAIHAYETALALQPNFPAALHGLGTAYAALGQHRNAASSFERAVGLEPHAAPSWLALGNARAALAAYEAATRAYDQALRLRPDLALAHLNRAMTYLVRGDFARGWPEYEWRHAALANAPQLGGPRWHGDTSLAGQTILIHAEQGLGDTLHVVRYVPRVAALAARVVLEVQPELVTLLVPFCARHRITLARRGDARPAYDCQIPLLSLPLALHVDADTLANDDTARYLEAPDAYRRKWRGSLGGQAKIKIGVAWSGRVQQQETRALPFAALAPLFALPGIDWIVLQRDWPADDLATFEAAQPPSVHRIDQKISDFADTAAIVERLDAVVSIDTSVAHLAGALGARLWLMLPFAADWRWFGDAQRTPWYPRARLVRQTAPGQWDDVVARVRDDIAEQVCTALPREN
jgi:tetratricopeptide (TPR) repeat protein